MSIGWLFSNPRVPPRALDEVELAEEARAVEPDLTFDDLTHEKLRAITAEHGCDLATALLDDRLRRSSEHSGFIEEVERVPLLGPRPCLRGKLLVVPAAFYREVPGAGGDGTLVRSVAERLGLSAFLASLSSTGLVSENAAALQRLLDEEPYPVVLVSMSKGGAEVRVALEEEPSLARKVSVWIQIGGLLRGSPLLDELLASSLPGRALVAAYLGASGAGLSLVRELSAAPGAILSRPFRTPRGLHVVNVLGLPLSSHLTGNAAVRHARLSPLGPNDGSTLALDAIAPGGSIYPVWGADHYFRVPAVAALLYRLFIHLARRGVLAS